jgi:hypothetical protein
VHSIVDGHSRYACSEPHPDERAETVTGFVERAFVHFATLGIEPKRLLADNGRPPISRVHNLPRQDT